MTTAQPETIVVPGRYPAAEWRPIDVNFMSGGNSPRLAIVHVMEGSLAGTDSWFRNPASEVSAHFGVGRDGTVIQWVNAGDIAWHAAAADDHSIGIETEGDSGEPLTPAQVGAVAGIFRWAHQHYPNIHAWLNTRPDNGSGLSWHGLGGAAWGNHPDCPGDPIRHQLGEILATATR